MTLELSMRISRTVHALGLWHSNSIRYLFRALMTFQKIEVVIIYILDGLDYAHDYTLVIKLIESTYLTCSY